MNRRTDTQSHYGQRDAQLREAFKELQTAYEELQATSETLKRENGELRTAQQALEIRQRCYRDLFQFAPDGYLITDLRGVIRDANHATRELLGLPIDGLRDKPLSRYLVPDERDAFRARLDRFAADPKWKDLGRDVWETRVRPHQRKSFPATLTLSPIRDDEGELVALRWRLQDLSSREESREREKLLEQLARDREETRRLVETLERDRDLLRVIMANTEACLAYLDPQFNFVRVNAAYAEKSGHSREELLGRNHFEIFPDEENEAIFRQVRDTGEPVAFQAKPFEYADQPERGVTYWDWTLVPVKDAQGRVQGLVFSLMDVTERIWSEQELRASKERFRLVADYTYDWECWLGPDGEYLYVSPACERVTGYPPEDFYDDPELLRSIIHPDDKNVLEEHLRERHEGHAVQGVDFRVVTPGGGVRWINHVCQPVYGAEGTWMGYRSSNRDITERKRAEREREKLLAQLEAERSRLMAILESAPEGILVVDADARVVLANAAAELLFGQPMPCDEGKTQEDPPFFYTEGSPCDPRYAHLFRRTLAGESQRGVELTLYPSESERRHLLLNAAPIRDAEGRITGAVGIFQNITARKRFRDRLEMRIEQRTAQLLELNRALRAEITERRHAEAELRASEARFRQVAEHIDEILWLTEPDTGRVLYLNPAYEEIWGRSLKEAPETMDGILVNVHPEDQDHIPADLMTVWEGQEAEFRIFRPDGEVRWLRTRAFPICDESGRPYRLAGITQDVTGERRALEALIDAEQLAVAGKLAASLAHEINNPLQAAMGCLELGQEQLEKGCDAGNYLQVTAEALERASRVVMQLRTLHQRAETEEKVPVDLNNLLEKVLVLTQRKCGDYGVEVIWTGAPDLPELELMSDAMQQVFLNLVLNALDAMPEGGSLRVSTSKTRHPPGVQVQFTDEGVGISPKTMKHLFEPFYTTKRDSLGLGLFISRNTIQQHGGHFEVESQKGEGTTFTIWLPLQSPEQVEEDE